MKVAIVDYGMGNICSIESSLLHIGLTNLELTSEHEALSSADKLILPGVGAFGNAINEMNKRNLFELITDLVINKKKPILGICLGMQLLGHSSTEGGFNKGLGFVKNSIERFDAVDISVPHVGFNQVHPHVNSMLFNGIGPMPDFYFTHSYRMLGKIEDGDSYCEYGGKFIAAFEKDNVAGVQFHPELSQFNGLALLKNFIDKF